MRLALALALAAAPALAAPLPPSPSEDARFLALADSYYAELAARQPVTATALGWHDHDTELDDVSAAGYARSIAWLHGWQKKLAAVDGQKLTPPHAIDLAMLQLSIQSSLVEEEDVRGWRRQPDRYAGLASQSVYVIMKRSFASPEARARDVIAREEKIPAMLREARKNLTEPARIFVEIALEEVPGIVEFFKRDVPSAFSTVKDPALLQKLKQSSDAAAQALADYGAWLKSDLLPRAHAPFAIGEALFRKKLHADEMIDTPLDELLARGEAELHRLQREFQATAAKIDPKKSWAEVQAEVQKEHPPADRLIADTQARLAGLRRFLVDKHIVTVPSEVMPTVQETPPFMRAVTFASMDTPGPFETRATEAYYNVTLPEKTWTPSQVEDFLRGAFCRVTIDTTSIHEAFPGHYVQFLWMPKMESKIRKIESASTNVEGWAHYSEQMLVDEGWGGGDPKLRLGQLQDALLRAARYVVGIRMHTRGMTMEEGIAFFQKEGFQSKKVAEMETKRGTEDPTYLYYTLGKLEILKLRDDYQKKLGAAYTLQKFHDAFLGQGALPIPLVRRALGL